LKEPLITGLWKKNESGGDIVRYMIDTNTFVFLCHHDFDKFDNEIWSILTDFENMFIISSESVREISLLIRYGKIDFPIWCDYNDVKSSLNEHGIEVRHVNDSHIKTFYGLEFAPDHRDPFDLMIISQAITEKLTLISSDTDFPFYTKQGLYLKQNFRGRKRR